MTQERAAVSSVWCISADAAAAGKVEDIAAPVQLVLAPDEGKMLYNYGIEGVSYDMVDGTAVLKPVMVANGFVRTVDLGCEFEPFGGEWATDAFMQCLFAGMTLEELDDAPRFFLLQWPGRGEQRLLLRHAANPGYGRRTWSIAPS